jgi:hypothetical protein
LEIMTTSIRASTTSMMMVSFSCVMRGVNFVADALDQSLECSLAAK